MQCLLWKQREIYYRLPLSIYKNNRHLCKPSFILQPIAFHLVALAVSNRLVLPLVELPQHLYVYAIIAEFLFSDALPPRRD